MESPFCPYFPETPRCVSGRDQICLMPSYFKVSTLRRRTTAPLAVLLTLLIVGAGFAVASPAPAAAPAAAPAQGAAAVKKPNVRVTKVTASSTSKAIGTVVATTLTLENVTSTPKSPLNTRLFLVNGSGTFRLGEAEVPPIRGEGQVTVRVSHTVDLKVPAGQYAVRACRGGWVAAETCRRSAATVTVAPALLVASSEAVAFGDVTPGSAPAGRDVTFTNDGQSATGALSIATTGSHAFSTTASTCASSLVPGASCTVSVAFAPAVPGAVSGTLTVVGTTASATAVALSGAGLGAATLAADEDNFAFGDTLVGATSAPVVLTVTNTGNITSGVPDVALAGASADDFDLNDDTCTAALAPGASCSVSITFTPTAAGDLVAGVSVSATPGGVVTSGLVRHGPRAGQAEPGAGHRLLRQRADRRHHPHPDPHPDE